MKTKFLLTLFALCALISTNLSAQTKRGAIVEPVGVSTDVELKVAVVVDKESVRPGPYARFAQKYLGVMAPLSNKDMYVISEALLFSSNESDYYSFYTAPIVAEMGVQVLSNTMSDTSFVKVNVDKNSTIEKSAELAAQQAAETVFSLRKRRIELVTGDAGENVFGSGLADALAEIDRLENEYIALFMGKSFTRREVKYFNVIPEKGKNSQVLFRFSETGGVMAVSDLSARLITLEMTVETPVVEVDMTRTKDKTVTYSTYDIANCRLIDGKREIVSKRVRIPQIAVQVAK